MALKTNTTFITVATPVQQVFKLQDDDREEFQFID